MWFLYNTLDAALRISLPPGKDLIVGRKDCDVLITGDQSISRRHAIIHVHENSKSSQVTLTDCKSKFGTIANGTKLSANQKIALSIGDELKFGQAPLTGNFKLVFEPLVFCCSGMAGSEKTKVRQLIKRLGGRLVSSWTTDCTHLVMSTLTVTIKVVSALSTCRPIVTPPWLEAAVQCIQEGKSLPITSDYQPEVVDTNLSGEDVSFRPNFTRTKLFQDRTFYFLNEKQHSSLYQCVQAAGAQCVLCETPNSVALEALVVKESLVLAVDDKHMEQLTEGARKWINEIETFLKSHGFRSILDSEIGFALLHMSIQKYCNPKNTAAESHTMPALPAPSLSQMPLSMHASTQDPPDSPPSHHHTSTPSQSNVTILAPDSELSTIAHSVQILPKRQSQDSNESNTSVVKVKESFMLPPKSSPIKRNITSTNGTKSSSNSKNKAKQPLLDVLFDDAAAELSQEEVQSKLNTGQHSIRGPLTSTQISGDVGHPRDVPPISKSTSSEFSLVDDSQPDHFDRVDKNTSVLPGLKSRTSIHEVSIVGTRSQCEILAPQSLDSTTRSSQDASILAPNSLGTPISQEKSSKKKDSLPDALMMTKLFQGKRKKRGIEETTGTTAATACSVEERATKKQRLEKDSSQISRTEEEVTGQLFGGLKSKRSHHKQQQHGKDQVMEAVVDSTVSTKAQGVATMHSCKGSSEPFKTPSKPNIKDKFSRPLDSIADAMSNSTVPHTPKKAVVSPVGSSTPFLSTRKRKRAKSHEEDMNEDKNTNALNDTLTNTQYTSRSVSQLAMTTPFTCLASMVDPSKTVPPSSTVLHTGGKRTKVRSADDEIWAEEPSGVAGDGRMDAENPLGSQMDVVPSRVYKPVYTEDGFIKARTKPKLQVSRMGRFGFRANLDLITSGAADGGDKGADERVSPSRPAVRVEIEAVSLLVHRDHVPCDDDIDEMDSTDEKNFKKFRKVQNVARGVPRFMSLVQYVPETNNTIQDWEVRDEEPDLDTRTEESSQDIFMFTTTRTRRRR